MSNSSLEHLASLNRSFVFLDTMEMLLRTCRHGSICRSQIDLCGMRAGD